MTTPFETFVNTELPNRPSLLTKELCGSYEGNPNDLSAPNILKLAPKGSFYLRNTDSILWRKKTDDPTSWEETGGGGGTPGPTGPTGPSGPQGPTSSNYFPGGW